MQTPCSLIKPDEIGPRASIGQEASSRKEHLAKYRYDPGRRIPVSVPDSGRTLSRRYFKHIPTKNALRDLEVTLDALSRAEKDTLAEAITDNCVNSTSRTLRRGLFYKTASAISTVAANHLNTIFFDYAARSFSSEEVPLAFIGQSPSGAGPGFQGCQ